MPATVIVSARSFMISFVPAQISANGFTPNEPAAPLAGTRVIRRLAANPATATATMTSPGIHA